jgi:hypothetical protein
MTWLHAYKIQLRRKIEITDSPKYIAFAAFMLREANGSENYLQQVMFMDEAAFHINGFIIRYNYTILRLQQTNQPSNAYMRPQMWKCDGDSRMTMWYITNRHSAALFTCLFTYIY